MALTGQEFRHLYDVLLDAYPTEQTLRQMVRFELNENLDRITDGSDQSSLVFGLIQWADRVGRTRELVQAAFNDVPGNLQVRDLYEEWFSADAVAPEPVVETLAASHIFLSYSHLDASFANRLIADLSQADLTVWIDDDLEPGTEHWDKSVDRAIRRALAVVVVLSPNAKASEWVNKELLYARTFGRRIFPILADGDERDSVPISLIDTQWVDARVDYANAVHGRLIPSLLRFVQIVGRAPAEDLPLVAEDTQPLDVVSVRAESGRAAAMPPAADGVSDFSSSADSPSDSGLPPRQRSCANLLSVAAVLLLVLLGMTMYWLMNSRSINGPMDVEAPPDSTTDTENSVSAAGARPNTPALTALSRSTPISRHTATPTPQVLRMQMRILSSSDWTTVALLSRNDILDQHTLEQHGRLAIAKLDGREIHMNQTLERAEQGQKFEIVQDLVLAEINGQSELQFSVELGCIGETTIEIYHTSGVAPLLLTRVLSGAFGCEEPERFTIDVDSLLTDAPEPPTWMDIRLELTTSSDWAAVSLAPHIQIAERVEYARSGELASVGEAGRTFMIAQPKSNAQKGAEIAITQDYRIRNQAEIDDISILVENGCVGMTSVNVLRRQNGLWHSLGTAVSTDCDLPGEVVSFSLNSQ